MNSEFVVTDEFIKLIFETKELLENKNVSYWIDEGTLLGIVREGNIIKGDHDFDFSAKYNDIKRIAEVCKSLECYGYNIKYQKGLPYIEDLIQIYLKNDHNMDNIHVEINIYYFNNGKAIRRDLHYPQGKYGKFLILLAKILNRREIDFLKSNNQKKMYLISLIPYKIRRAISCVVMDIYIAYCTTVWHVVPEILFNNFTEIEFLGHMFPMPEDYKNYLSYRYGIDWRVPVSNWIWKDSPDQAIEYNRLNIININHKINLF